MATNSSFTNKSTLVNFRCPNDLYSRFIACAGEGKRKTKFLVEAIEAKINAQALGANDANQQSSSSSELAEIKETMQILLDEIKQLKQQNVKPIPAIAPIDKENEVKQVAQMTKEQMIAFILEQKKNGLNYAEIADKFNEAGVLTLLGKEHNKDTVRGLIKNNL